MHVCSQKTIYYSWCVRVKSIPRHTAIKTRLNYSAMKYTMKSACEGNNEQNNKQCSHTNLAKDLIESSPNIIDTIMLYVHHYNGQQLQDLVAIIATATL